MNKLYYQILSISSIVIGGLALVEWLQYEDTYSLIGGGVMLVLGISIMQLLKEVK